MGGLVTVHAANDAAVNARPDGHREPRAIGYLTLFASAGTLVCCALPSLLVLLGLGATVATVVSAVPSLVTLSRHKEWVFAASALLVAGNIYYVYRLAPRMLAERGRCEGDDPTTCARVSRVSRVLLWISVTLLGIGAAVAYLLPLALSPSSG